MANIKLDDLTLNELKQLQKDVAKAIATFEARQRAEALSAIEATAKEMGFSLSDLVSAASKKKAVSPPKYQHPENPDVTWTGRGRQPAWIKEAEAAGKSREEFLIK